jgi:hypothetical protein
MKGHTLRALVVTVALLLAVGTYAHAQSSTAHIGFSFLAAGKVLPAGNYSVDVAANGNVVLTPEGGAALDLPQIKEISKRKVDRLKLVFDRVGSVRFLSEVWVPGKGGFTVYKADSADERETVDGTKGTK